MDGGIVSIFFASFIVSPPVPLRYLFLPSQLYRVVPLVDTGPYFGKQNLFEYTVNCFFLFTAMPHGVQLVEHLNLFGRILLHGVMI